MKAILLSIRPEWLVKILNREKTIEVRKLFPKNYVGWVYIYCCKNDNLCRISKISQDRYICGKDFDTRDFPHLSSGYDGKGKVVARFWCDKVDEYVSGCLLCSNSSSLNDYEKVLKSSCLTDSELYNYCKYSFFAIHISKLEIFDRPRKLSEFRTWCKDKPMKCEKCKQGITKVCSYRLTKAPQNYCYVEGE